MRKIKIAVVSTCYNRKNVTQRCMEQLNTQMRIYSKDMEFRIFICDDASTDGTAAMLADKFPEATVVHGSGNLYWARGMAEAMILAEQYKPDFYLMVNDDVDFDDNMIDIMLNSYTRQGQLCAIVGNTCSQADGAFTYGGIKWNHKVIGEVQKPVEPSCLCPECDQTNWNCFLLPSALYDRVGKIDRKYMHSMADFDYANRIRALGYCIFVAYQYIGTCERNSIQNTWKDTSLPFWKRIQLLHEPKGIPLKSSIHYNKQYYGMLFLYRVISPYLYITKSSIKAYIVRRRKKRNDV